MNTQTIQIFVTLTKTKNIPGSKSSFYGSINC